MRLSRGEINVPKSRHLISLGIPLLLTDVERGE
jgi:hypothetical protein